MKAADVFSLKILSVDETVFDQQVKSALFPGVSGAFCVLPKHENMVIGVSAGFASVVKQDGSDEKIKIESGILKICNNQCVLFYTARA